MKIRKLSLLLIVMLLSSCKEVTGTWKSFVATDEKVISTVNTRVTPFNTVMQINYFLNDENEDNETLFNNVTNLFNNEVARLHKNFDRHYNYLDNDELINNIKVINDSYGTNKEIKCSNELYSLLKLSVECYELTDGYFNVFSGNITDFWNSIFDKAYNDYDATLKDYEPSYNEELASKLALLVDSMPSNVDEINQQLTFNDENKTVIFNKCDFNNDIVPLISTGGIAKGYATDLIKEKLVNNGYKDGYLISGGSSISTLDKPIYSKDSKGQKISVINPEISNIIEKKPAFSLHYKNEFNFSTSGNYTDSKNYSFIDENDNIIYRHHIINPFTGYPESYYRSVSIKTSYFSNAYVDAFSTAFMNLSIEDGKELRNKILSQFKDADLELYYLVQKGKKANATFTLHATGCDSKDVVLGERMEVVYEE